jgi:hypothetical protein
MNPEDLLAVIASQLTDPFRIGLLAALIYTTIRNAAVTGWIVPLASGIVFVAFIIAVTMPSAGLPQTVVISAGIISNSIIAAIISCGLFLWRRFFK